MLGRSGPGQLLSHSAQGSRLAPPGREGSRQGQPGDRPTGKPEVKCGSTWPGVVVSFLHAA